MTTLAQIAIDDNESPGPTQRMGRILLNSGKIKPTDIKTIVELQNKRGMRFGEAARKLGLVTTADVRAALAKQFACTPVPEKGSRLSRALTAAFLPQSAEVEALRSLRSELMLRYFNASPHLTLALCGTDDARGIAQTTANLAIVFSQLGLRTLLIDGNLREPQLHNLFGIGDRHPGLSDVIAGRAQPQPVEVAPLHSLWLVHAGTRAPNPQELLASRNYGERMDELTNQFDVTLINTSPMKRTRDAQLIAAHCGAALLVAQQHKSRMKEVESMCANLWGVGVRLLGVALRQ